jgi:hypothetical protein
MTSDVQIDFDCLVFGQSSIERRPRQSLSAPSLLCRINLLNAQISTHSTILEPSETKIEPLTSICVIYEEQILEYLHGALGMPSELLDTTDATSGYSIYSTPRGP